MSIQRNDYVFQDYIAGFDELNKLTSYVYSSTVTKATEDRKKEVTDNVLSFLILAYKAGIEAVNRMLWDVSIDEDLMYAAIYLNIDGKTFEDRIADALNQNNESALQRLVTSEYHRVYNNALYDGAKQYESKGRKNTKGLARTVKKVWQTMLDDRVRDTHAYLEGTQVGLDDKFYTFDGDSARFPGDFEKPENNVNCRCVIRLESNVW